jgi:hypothetical protein
MKMSFNFVGSFDLYFGLQILVIRNNHEFSLLRDCR